MLFGNVKRIRKLSSNGDTLLWYSGDKSFTVVSVDSGTVLKKFSNVISGFDDEAVAFFDVYSNHYLFVSTYAKNKKSVYLHNLANDAPMCYREMSASVFRGSRRNYEGLTVRDFQLFNGCMCREAGLVVLGGKLDRNFIFEKELVPTARWEGALFTYKIEGASLTEYYPQTLISTDEPIYQLKVIADTTVPTILATSRVSKLFLLKFCLNSLKWQVLSTLSGIGKDRNIL